MTATLLTVATLRMLVLDAESRVRDNLQENSCLLHSGQNNCCAKSYRYSWNQTVTSTDILLLFQCDIVFILLLVFSLNALECLPQFKIHTLDCIKINWKVIAQWLEHCMAAQFRDPWLNSWQLWAFHFPLFLPHTINHMFIMSHCWNVVAVLFVCFFFVFP